MTCSDEWQEKAYDKTWDETYKSLEARKKTDSSFGVDELRAILNHLYVNDGNDQGGRGCLQDVIMQATLDAHEAFLGRLRSDKA